MGADIIKPNRKFIILALIITLQSTCCSCTELDFINYTDNVSALAYGRPFVFLDSSGFANSTGAMRIDWEHEARTTGGAKNATNLTARGFFFPGAGESYDWLPCCLSYSPLFAANLTRPKNLTERGGGGSA
jgi:hypothetical protein